MANNVDLEPAATGREHLEHPTIYYINCHPRIQFLIDKTSPICFQNYDKSDSFYQCYICNNKPGGVEVDSNTRPVNIKHAFYYSDIPGIVRM